MCSRSLLPQSAVSREGGSGGVALAKSGRLPPCGRQAPPGRERRDLAPGLRVRVRVGVRVRVMVRARVRVKVGVKVGVGVRVREEGSRA